MRKRKLRTPPYLSDLGLVFFCLGADLDAALDSLGRVSADIPPPDCSPILCLSYSRRTTSGREGGGWNVTGAFIGAGSSLESVLVFLRPVEFFLSKFKRRRFYVFITIFAIGHFRIIWSLVLRSWCSSFHVKIKIHSHVHQASLW